MNNITTIKYTVFGIAYRIGYENGNASVLLDSSKIVINNTNTMNSSVCGIAGHIYYNSSLTLLSSDITIENSKANNHVLGIAFYIGYEVGNTTILLNNSQVAIKNITTAMQHIFGIA